MTPSSGGPGQEPEVTSALRRIADTTAPERVAPDGDGLARAAMTEAVGIRRQRRFVGLVAAAAAVAAIAVPVALRSGAPAPLPAGATVAATKPAVGMPLDRPTTTAPAVRSTARVTATLPAPLTSTRQPGPDAVVRPYVVDGVYHGQSTSLRLGSAGDLSGLVDVLNLAGGARVLRFEPSTGAASTLVQSADGAMLLRLPGASGPTVADASGKRFAMLDLGAGSLSVRDDRGRVLAQTSAPGIRSLAGFAGSRVLVSDDQGSALWDPAADTIEPWANERALDASDTASVALLVNQDGSGSSCWRVRSTAKTASVQSAPRCGPATAVALTADGQYVLAQDKAGTGASRVDVFDALTGTTVLTVSLDDGVTVSQIGFRIGSAQLVLGAVSPDGGNRLVSCTLNGRCQSLTPTITKATPSAPEPYLLVRD